MSVCVCGGARARACVRVCVKDREKREKVAERRRQERMCDWTEQERERGVRETHREERKTEGEARDRHTNRLRETGRDSVQRQ